MPMQPIQIPDDTGLGWLIILSLTILGTLARIAYNWMTGHTFTLFFALAQAFISIFASALTLMITTRLEWKVFGVSTACGLAAWLGIKILDFFEKRLIERLQGKKDESKSD